MHLALAYVLAMCNHGHMDTANLEYTARRYRDAEAALEKVRAELQIEAVAFLQQHASERGAQAAAANITGWSREHLRGLRKKADEEAERARREAEMEALRRKVRELSGSNGQAEPRSPRPVPKPKPIAEGRPLTDEEAATLAELARSRADDLQTRKLDQDAAQVGDAYKDFTVVSSAMSMGLLKHDEVYGEPERPVGSEEKNA